MIYMIGGVARSGKTAIRKYSLDNFKMSGIETDSIRTMFELSMPQLGISHENQPMVNAKRIMPYMKAFIESRFFFEEDYVIEGDVIIPDTILGFLDNSKIKSLFIGYPDISLIRKLGQLGAYNGWHKNISAADLSKKIELFIRDSKIIADQCALNKLPFINSSNLSLEEVISSAIRIFGLES